MIISVCGMPRSGSTFIFNIAREILSRGGKRVGTLVSDDLTPENGCVDNLEYLIVKGHCPGQDLTTRIRDGRALAISSFRAPEEAIVSWMATFGHDFETVLGLIEKWARWRSGAGQKVVDINYVGIATAPVEVIIQIQELFGAPDLTAAEELCDKYSREAVHQYTRSISASEAIDIGFSYYDHLTLFHRNHISSLANIDETASLSPAQLSEVRTRLGPYIKPDGKSHFEAP